MIGDTSRIYLGIDAAITDDHWGVEVVGDAFGAAPQGQGFLQPAGITHKVAGVAFCN